MQHIKDSIKKFSINNWIECNNCNHMCHPSRIESDYYHCYNVCNDCYNEDKKEL